MKLSPLTGWRVLAAAGTAVVASLASAETVTWQPGWRTGDYWVVRAPWIYFDDVTQEPVRAGYTRTRFVVDDDTSASGEPALVLSVRMAVGDAAQYENAFHAGRLLFDPTSYHLVEYGDFQIGAEVEPSWKRVPSPEAAGSINEPAGSAIGAGGAFAWPVLRASGASGVVTLGDETLYGEASEPGGTAWLCLRQRVTRIEGGALVEWWRGPNALAEAPDEREPLALRFRDGMPWPDMLNQDGTVYSDVFEVGKLPKRERPKLPPGTMVLTPDGPKPVVIPDPVEPDPAPAPVPPGSPAGPPPPP